MRIIHYIWYSSLHITQFHLMPARSAELINVGYFLSREGKINPPVELGTTNWLQAYMMFYESLNDGRTPSQFQNSLKNVRDQFDGYFPDTLREGWKIKNNPILPAKLSARLKSTYENFEGVHADGVWKIIKPYSDFSFQFSKQELNDAFQPQKNEFFDEKTVLSEGKKKVRISTFIERNQKIRRLAIEQHGLNCAACGFNFQNFYGEFAKGFIEIHHVIPLHKELKNRRETNILTDLIPLCSNCHSVVHRKKDHVVSLEGLLKMINRKK